MGKFTDEDFYRPLVKDLNGQYIRKGNFVANGKYFLDELTYDDLAPSKNNGNPGLDYLQRKWLQIAVATDNEDLQKGF